MPASTDPHTTNHPAVQAHAVEAGARMAKRRLAKARFVIETAIEQGVEIAILGEAHDPWILAYAPTATNEVSQQACEQSFRDAASASFPLVALLAEERERRGSS